MLIAVPPLLPKYFLEVLISVLFTAYLGASWNILGGYAGQFSFGHAAFFGIGAYTSTLLLLQVGLTPWVGMLAGGGARRRVRAARGVSLVPLWPQGPVLLARHARLRRDAARGGREHQGRGIVARAGRALGPARARHVHLRGQAAVLLRHPRHGAGRHGAHARDRARPARLCAGRGARERGRRRGGGRRRPRHEAPRHGHLLVPHRARRHLLRAVLRVHRPRHHVRAGRVDPGPPAGDRGRRGHRARARSSAPSC